MTFSYKDKKNDLVSPHFLYKECIGKGTLRCMFENGKYDTVNYNPMIFACLETIREKWGVIVINSMYRPLDYNLKIGSTKTSQHVSGNAVDFYIPKANLKDVCLWIDDNVLKSSIGGLGYYGTFIHLDLKDNTLRRWIQLGNYSTYKSVGSDFKKGLESC